jgi:hypothetical protein
MALFPLGLPVLRPAVFPARQEKDVGRFQLLLNR